jgi:hypothetical protein
MPNQRIDTYPVQPRERICSGPVIPTLARETMTIREQLNGSIRREDGMCKLMTGCLDPKSRCCPASPPSTILIYCFKG